MSASLILALTSSCRVVKGEGEKPISVSPHFLFSAHTRLLRWAHCKDTHDLVVVIDVDNPIVAWAIRYRFL